MSTEDSIHGRALIPGFLTVRNGAIAAGIVAFSLALPTLFNDFVMEEKREVIVENAEIRDLSNIPSFFTAPWIGSGLGRGYYRPVVTTLYTIEYALFGLNPTPWHGINALLYGSIAALFALLVGRITRSAGTAWLSGLLFAVLPVHCEPVAAISYQTSLLAGLFTILTLLIFERICTEPAAPWRFALLGLTTALGIMSKEGAYTIPLLLVVFVLVTRPPNWKRVLVTAWCVTVPLALFFYVSRNILVESMPLSFFAGQSPTVVLFTMLGVVKLYAGLLLFPVRLAPFYDWFIIPFESELTYRALLGFLILACCAVGFFWSFRKKFFEPALGVAWFLAALLPFTHIVPFIVVAADRFLFIPSLGFCLAMGAILNRGLNADRASIRRAVFALVLVGLAAYGARFAVRTMDWRNDLSLNRSTALQFPRTPTPHLNLARWYEEKGDFDAAEAAIQRAVDLVPNWSVPTKRLEELRAGRPGG